MRLDNDAVRQVRDHFPYLNGGLLYLNHAATSPLATPVTEAMRRHLAERSEGKVETYLDDLRMVDELRDGVARLVNAESPSRIALTTNTSDAINIVASGLPWRPGDRILTMRGEFPANVYPWWNLRRQGVAIDFLPDAPDALTAEAIGSALRPGTRVLALSAVQFLSGFRADCAAIGALCRRNDVIFAVDGIQAVGAVRIDVQGMHIDALASGAQKWMLGPQGSGFLYLTEDLQAQIQPAHLGWLSVEDPWQFFNYEQPLARGARRYEGGTLPFPCLWGMYAAVQLLNEVGMEAIEERILHLGAHLIGLLQQLPDISLVTPVPSHQRAGIVTFGLPAGTDPAAVFQELQTSRVIVSLREQKIRVSPHFYNCENELDRFVQNLRTAILR